jgi:hypothetical protein
VITTVVAVLPRSDDTHDLGELSRRSREQPVAVHVGRNIEAVTREDCRRDVANVDLSDVAPFADVGSVRDEHPGGRVLGGPAVGFGLHGAPAHHVDTLGGQVDAFEPVDAVLAGVLPRGVTLPVGPVKGVSLAAHL